jgi:hypothetical protein
MICNPETFRTWRINGEMYFFSHVDFNTNLVMFADCEGKNQVGMSYQQFGEILAVWIDSTQEKTFWK